MMYTVEAFFFFKQKTAYDMRISDWSSDVCSSDLKVRGTLMEKGVTFGSNELTILPPQNENYCPQYVRLRLRSEAAAKHRPVSSFTGQSSVDSEGFDPLVVPTLVDHE